MKIKELFNSRMEIFRPQLSKRPASLMGTTRFRLTLDKENIKTPHYIMAKVEDILENRLSLVNGLRQLVLFVMPDLKFHSDDERTSTFANEWLNMRDSLEREIFNFIYMFLGCGNGYFEPQYKTMTNGKKVLDMCYNVPSPSTVYYNVDARSEDDYWIVEYPQEVLSVSGVMLRFYQVNYVVGSYTWRTNVWGTTIHKNKLEHLKYLWSRSPFYGSGLLSAAIDNEDVAEEILKNWALAAKFRSLGKKIIGFYNADGETVDPQEIETIRNEFNMLEEEDSLLVNKKFEAQDLAFTGTDNMMQQELEFLRKDSGSSLTPNYMTAFSQDSSLATASEAKVPFALSIESTQKLIEGFLNNFITKNLKECYPFLDDDLVLELGKADLYSRTENFMNMSQLYNMRACTFNELRIASGLSPVEGGDMWGQEPPLDKTSTTINVKEPNGVPFERLREKYKKELKIISPPTLREGMKIKLKTDDIKTANKDFNFKEAMKDVLK